MKKIIKTGIAVGTVMIFVQIGNLIYAEENPIQNTEYVVESENVSENTENVTESYTEDVAGTDEYAIKKTGWNLEGNVWYYYNTDGTQKKGRRLVLDKFKRDYADRLAVNRGSLVLSGRK